jgi:hypothetical protein
MQTTPVPQRSIDVSGLPEEVVRLVESLVILLRGDAGQPSPAAPFSSRQEWIQAIREWAHSHEPPAASADWTHESICAGHGE